MDYLIRSRDPRQARGECFLARLHKASRIAHTNQYHLGLEISGKFVDALLDVAESKTLELPTGKPLLVEGGWEGTPWHSRLRIDRLALQFLPEPVSLPQAGEVLYDAALQKLMQLLRPALHRFVDDVLRSDIGFRFKVLPASRFHHHNQDGGLFQHSIECAMLAGQLAFTWLPRAEAELTLVAALFHDIGKCAPYRNDEGFYLPRTHESQTLPLLSPYLDELEKLWRPGAYLLREMLSYEKHHGRYPAFPGTLLIRLADQFSTALNRRQALFKRRPTHHHYVYDHDFRQLYLRLPESRWWRHC